VKINHLRKSDEFAAVVKSGRKARGRLVTLYAGKGENAEDLTVGIIISKKSISKAVTRNYLRRVIYQYFKDAGKKWQTGKTIIVRVGQPGPIKGKRPLSRQVREDLDSIAESSRI